MPTYKCPKCGRINFINDQIGMKVIGTCKYCGYTGEHTLALVTKDKIKENID